MSGGRGAGARWWDHFWSLVLLLDRRLCISPMKVFDFARIHMPSLSRLTRAARTRPLLHSAAQRIERMELPAATSDLYLAADSCVVYLTCACLPVCMSPKSASSAVLRTMVSCLDRPGRGPGLYNARYAGRALEKKSRSSHPPAHARKSNAQIINDEIYESTTASSLPPRRAQHGLRIAPRGSKKSFLRRTHGLAVEHDLRRSILRHALVLLLFLLVVASLVLLHAP